MFCPGGYRIPAQGDILIESAWGHSHGVPTRPGFALVKIRFVSETCPMPMTLDQIVEETRELPGEVVAELIDRIMVARHGGMEPSVAESWKTETDRRIAEIESGKVKGVTPAENAARIKKILRR